MAVGPLPNTARRFGTSHDWKEPGFALACWSRPSGRGGLRRSGRAGTRRQFTRTSAVFRGWILEPTASTATEWWRIFRRRIFRWRPEAIRQQHRAAGACRQLASAAAEKGGSKAGCRCADDLGCRHGRRHGRLACLRIGRRLRGFTGNCRCPQKQIALGTAAIRGEGRSRLVACCARHPHSGEGEFRCDDARCQRPSKYPRARLGEGSGQEERKR